MARPGARQRFALVVIALGALAGEARGQWPLTFWTPASQHVDVARLDRWMRLVEQHEPGRTDDALDQAAQWSNADLRVLWLDVQALIQMVSHPERTRFRVETSPDLSGRGRGTSTRTFATPYDQDTARKVVERVTAMGHTATLQRAAVLHTDATTLAADVVSRSAGTTMIGATMQSRLGDGDRAGLESVSVHGAIARAVLNGLAPHPRDHAFVRDFYRATVADAQRREFWDAEQLASGLELFPTDPVLLLLKGCQHEAYAAPLYQAFMRGLRETRLRPDIGDAASELERAERAFRAALESDPALAEAQVHLGRVLGLRGQRRAAIDALSSALAAGLEPAVEYYARVFLGAEHQGAGAWTAAREQFDRAAALDPGSRVPFLGLAHVARAGGDPETIPGLLHRALALPTPAATADPWWMYRVSQARSAATWLDEVRRTAKGAQ